MPSSKKVAWSQLRVGVLVVVAMVILVVLVFLITGSKGLFTKEIDEYLHGANVADALEVEQVFAQDRIEVPAPPAPRGPGGLGRPG